MPAKGTGKTGNAEQRAELAAEAYDMRLKGMSQTAIGKALGVSHTLIAKLCQEYVADIILPVLDDMRKAETEKLDRLEARGWKLLDGPIYAYHQGKVIMHEGKPVEDPGKRKDIAAEIRRTSESRRKLWALDMPVKTEHVNTNRNEDSFIDDSARKLFDEMKAKNDASIEKLGE